MNFTLRILGTASAMPVSDKNPSAQVLDVHGRLFLIDCAEGTQKQMRCMHISFMKIQGIFISHIHGDHIFGIFGVLSTMAMYGRTGTLDIYAPQSFGPILKFYMSYFSEGMNYRINHVVLKSDGPVRVYGDQYLNVTAFPLNHKIDCYGFRFDGIPSAKNSKVPPSYAYCSDTAPFEALPEWVKGVRVLYHESTYISQFKDKAESRYHSTAADAAWCALKAGAGKLILGHYSSRIRDSKVFEDEAREIFPQSYAADDGDVFEID